MGAVFNTVVLAGIIVITGYPLSFGSSLSLKEFLTAVSEHDPLFEAEELNVAAARAGAESLRESSQWRIFTSGRYFYSEPVAVSPFVPESFEMLEAGGGAERLFWSTGGVLRGRMLFSRLRQDFPPITLSAEQIPIEITETDVYEGEISVTYTQPILRNFGSAAAEAPYRARLHETAAQELYSIKRREEALRLAGEAYIDWVLLRTSVNILSERIAVTEEQFSIIKKREESGLADAAEVLRSRIAITASRQALMRARTRLETIETKLELLSGIGISAIEPVHDLFRKIDVPEEADADLENLRVMGAARRSVRASEIEARASDRQRLPELSVTAGTGLLSGASAFEDAFIFSLREYSVFLDFSYPLGGAAEARARSARESAKAFKRQAARQRSDLEAAVSSLLKTIENYETLMDLEGEIVSASLNSVREERRLYEMGRREIVFVYQSMEALYDSRLSQAETAAQYGKAHLRLLELLDMLYGPGR